MKRLGPTTQTLLRSAALVACGAAAFLRATGPAAAATPGQKVEISAMVTLSGPALQLRHAGLVQGSPVTKDVIILGEAGPTIPPIPPAWASRLTTLSDFGPEETRDTRVTLEYRALPPAGSEGALPPFALLPVIEGRAPLAFAFQIPRGELSSGQFEYRILAQTIKYTGGVAQILDETTFPTPTPEEPEPTRQVGLQANASEPFGPDGGRFSLRHANQAVGQTSIDIPAGLLQGLTNITVDEVPAGDPSVPPGLSNPITVYRMASDPPFKGVVQVSVLYPDFEYPRGADGTIDGTNTPVTATSLVVWDGFEWRRIGGRVERRSNTMVAKLPTLGFVALVAAPPLSPAERGPAEKIITPNNDGTNDEATFTFGDLTQNVRVEIFDVSGRRVRTLESQTTPFWDGRDDDGSIVESGVYIYQFNVDGQKISGLIAVAK